jgi:hypothetical protein
MSSVNLSIISLTWTGPGLNLSDRSDRPASKSLLCYGTVGKVKVIRIDTITS